jgi:WD40 repeat protein
MPTAIHSFAPPTGTVFCAIAFSDRGDTLFGATTSGALYAFYLARNKFDMVELGSCVLAIASSKHRDGEVLLGLSNGSAVCVQMRTQTRVCSLNDHSGPVNHVDFECHGNLALTGSSDSVILWNADNWTRLRTLGGHSSVLQAGFYGAGFSECVALLSNSHIFMWDLQHYQMKADLRHHEKALQILHFAVSDNGRTLAAVCADTVCLWDLSNDVSLICTVRTPPVFTGLSQVFFCPGSERRVALLAAGGGAVLFASLTGQSLEMDSAAAISAPDGQQYRCFALGAQGRFCATCCMASGTIKIHGGDDSKSRSSWKYSEPNSDNPSWTPLYQLAQLDPSRRRLNRHRLRALLGSFGQFPSKHRLLVWRFLLKLPENHEAFTQVNLLKDACDRPFLRVSTPSC